MVKKKLFALPSTSLMDFLCELHIKHRPSYQDIYTLFEYNQYLFLDKPTLIL